METESPESREPQAAKLTSSQKWRWVGRVNVLVGALLVALVLRARTAVHLVPKDAISAIAFVIALASALGTLAACREDVLEHRPASGRRPDHFGTYAWHFYMIAVLMLYLAFFLMHVSLPLGATAAIGAFAVLMPLFGLGFVASAIGVVRDRDKLRALLGLTFPLVALVLGSVAVAPFSLDPRGGPEAGAEGSAARGAGVSAER